MTIYGESHSTPGDDRIESKRLNAVALVDEFQDFAYQDIGFSYHEHQLINPSIKWHTMNGTSWDINFLAQHVYEGNTFMGDLYGITLSLTREIDYLSEDFKESLTIKDTQELPKEEKIINLKLTHISQYILSQNAELGWSTYKRYTTTEYAGDNEAGPIYAEKEYHFQEDFKLIDVSMIDKSLANADKMIQIVKSISDINDDSIDIINQDIDKFVIEESQLKRAYNLLLIFQTGDETDFDISSVMPEAFLE